MMKKVLSLVMMGIASLGLLVPVTLVNAQAPGADGGWDSPSGFGNASAATNIEWVPGTKDGLRGASLLNSIKTAINWTLGILSLIALVVLLWGGFQMVTAAGDEGKYKKGFTILKQAAIGLVIIGVSWLIVSAIIWMIGLTTWGNSGSGELKWNTA